MSHVVRPRLLFVVMFGMLMSALVLLSNPAAADPATTCEGLSPTHEGTGGDDVIIGTDGDDVILARGGNDVIEGGPGDDVICAGGGDDIVDGGEGNDIIRGGGGADTIDGGPGHDVINGGPAADVIDGGPGRDDLQGKTGRDRINGGAGADVIRGGDNADRIWGDGGNDDINGQQGDDRIRGGFGNDTLKGHVGDDLLWGNNGDDILFADSGVDTSDGGSDFDRCLASETAVNCEDDDLNDPPAAANDAFATDEDTATAGDLFADNGGGEDSDPNADTLAVTAVDGDAGAVGVPTVLGSGATITVLADGSLDYDPAGALDSLAAGAVLEDEFTYTVSDPLGENDTATVTVTVTGVNDEPVAVDDAEGTDEDDPILIVVLANDDDVDGDELSLDSYTQPTSGFVAQIGDSLLYFPDEDFNGDDGFTYTVSDGNGGEDTAAVSITVTPVNDDPVATDDDAVTDEDVAVNIDVLPNDNDVDGDELSISSYTQPDFGSVTQLGDLLVYTPDADANGVDEFTYTVSDGNGGADIGNVTVTVNAVPDGPVAQDDEISAFENDELAAGSLFDDNGNGPDVDPDGDPLTVTHVDGGAIVTPVFVSLTNGVVEVSPDGSYEYVPGEGFDSLPLGSQVSDTFSYTITDGASSDGALVEVVLVGVNDDPVAGDDGGYETDEETSFDIPDLLDNDDDIDAGDVLAVTAVDGVSAEGAALTLNPDGTVTYDPAGALDDVPVGGSVDDTFTYTVSDGNGGSDTATVTVTVNGVNDDPVAEDDEGDTTEDSTSLVVTVLANDDDVDGDTISVTSIDLTGTVGIVTVLPDDTIRYNPAGRFEWLAVGESATDSFGYTISDGNGGSDTATVTVTVNGVNDAPVADDESAVDGAETDEDSSVDIAVLVGDTDVDESDELSVASVDTTGTVGAVSINLDGTVNYDPNGQFEWLGDEDSTTDSFDYTVSDGNGGSDTATVTVTIYGVNDDPVAENDAPVVSEDDAPVAVDVLDNDDDVEGDALTVTSVDTTGTSGSVTLVDGVVSYGPDGAFEALAVGDSTTDTFTYTVSDGNGGSDTATVTVTVNGVNDDPIAADDSGDAFRLETGSTSFFTGNVLDNDDDIDGGALIVVFVDLAGTQGTVAYQGDGTFEYENTAALGEGAEDSWSYTVSDGNGGTDTATVTVRINSAPVADDETPSTDEDSDVDVAVLVGDTDGDADDLVVATIDTTGTTGLVSVNLDDTINYDPNGQYEGLDDGESDTDVFTYTVADPFLGTDVGTVTVTIDGVNDAPVMNEASYGFSVPEDAVVSTSVGTVGASDVDVEPLTYSITAGNTGTAFAIDETTGEITVAAALDYETTDSYSLTVQVSDGTASDSVTVTVTVTDVAEDEIVVTADNTVMAVYVNGVAQSLDANAGNWGAVTTITIDLSPGDVVAWYVQDSGGTGGALGEVTVNGTTHVTDSSWKASEVFIAGWEAAAYDDSGWASATQLGPYGSTAPWGSSVTGFSNTSAQWIWSADSDAHNDVYLRFTVPGGV